MTTRFPTEILSTHTRALFDVAVTRAVELLRAGQVVAVPTETVYGLAANALDVAAVRRIYEAKGRPAHNPIIVHVNSVTMARRCVRFWPRAAGRLARAFWPGPLTLVLPRAREIPDIVTGGGPTVGVRWPRHPFIQAVIDACGLPLAAPSANRSTRVSPTTARHVLDALDGRILLVVDGGPCAVGIESTVLDLTVEPPRVLRPGMIHEESLRAVLSGSERLPTGSGAAPRARARGNPNAGSEGAEPGVVGELRSPGLLPKHYSPRARLVLLEWADDVELRARLAGLGTRLASVHIIAHNRIPSGARFDHVSLIPHDPAAFARALYAELHRCDDEGASVIVVEAPPEAPEWRAILDRLRRAAA